VGGDIGGSVGERVRQFVLGSARCRIRFKQRWLFVGRVVRVLVGRVVWIVHRIVVGVVVWVLVRLFLWIVEWLVRVVVGRPIGFGSLG
jgi:hypothetical protein